MGKMNSKKTALVISATIFALGSMSHAQESAIPLSDYLSSMNHQKVTIEGRLKYDKDEMSGADFVFYNAEGKPFKVIWDAGRRTREEVIENCKARSFMATLREFCKFKGTATVEISGGSIALSVDSVEELIAP